MSNLKGELRGKHGVILLVFSRIFLGNPNDVTTEISGSGSGITKSCAVFWRVLPRGKIKLRRDVMR